MPAEGPQPPRAAAPPDTPQAPPVIRRAAGGRLLTRLLRVVLPSAAVLLVAGAILWPELFPNGSRVGVEVSVVEPEKADQEAMFNAVYSGVDAQGRPFTLTAERVHSDPAEPRTLKLEKPDGRIEMKDGRTLSVVAREGVYDRKADVLDLAGDVTLRHGEDLTTRTSQARIDLEAGTASGDQPVSGRASFGTIDGTGFRISQQGDVIAVGGPAHMTIDPKAEPRLP